MNVSLLVLCYQLSKEENEVLRSQFGTLKHGTHSKYLPFAFNEHGILMLSSVLNSEIAIKISVQIIETFVQLRQLANNYEEIMNKISQIESQHNEQFSEVYEVLQQLLSKPEEEPRTKIGCKK